MAAIHILNMHRRQVRNLKKYRNRTGFGDLNDDEIVNRYRLDRESIEFLVGLLHDDLSKPSNRGLPVDPLNQVLVTLRFLAKGDFYSEIADNQGISRSTISRIVRRCVFAINARLDNIKFPLDEDVIRHTKVGFYRKCHIPNIVGAIDGTLIPIVAPAVDEYVYVSRKGYHAINVQAVVDHKMRFTDVVARWPGSQHDSSIFDSSGLKTHLETNNTGCLLGDSGYPLKNYLLTPVLNPTTRPQENYNSAHCAGRIVVEKAFGVLKSRFRCLHKTGGCLMLSPEMTCGVVNTCMRLHNLCLENNVPQIDVQHFDDSDNDAVIQPVRGSAIDFRNNVIRTM